MVDKVYKKDLPELRQALKKLRDSFSNLDSKTDWNRLRIDPLLKHLVSLEQLSVSPEFSLEFSRLTKGVKLFHSDLVYFKTNVLGLQEVLESEKKSTRRRKKRP